VMVEKYGYHDFFLITALLGVPTLILIALQWRQDAGGTQAPLEEAREQAAERP
jgi:MFS transporter, PAT family, beta-lactamase induction signal transducer AmpG